jgi:hypothetical protein
MDTLIYSASPLKAFSGSLFLLAFLFVLGGLGAISAIFGRRQKVYARVGLGCASVILLLAGVGSAIVTYRTYQSGDVTALVRVDEKNVVTRNCDNVSRTCTDYVVEATDGRKYYGFNLGQAVWDEIEVNACYEFTYYPAQSLLGEYLQEENEYADLYETTANIARIERVRCP